MLLKLITIVILSGIGAVLYRLGGQGKPFNTRYRDIGVSLVSVITLLTLFPETFRLHLVNLFVYLMCFGVSWGALSAYWQQDEKRWGYFWHGLGLALSVLPIAILTKHFVGFGIRCLVLPTTIALCSEYIGQDWLEEGGRGFLIIITLPLLIL